MGRSVAAKVGDVVLVGVCGGDLMLAAVAEEEVEVAGGANQVPPGRGGDEGLFGGGDLGGGGLGEVCKEDVAPEGGTRSRGRTS